MTAFSFTLNGTRQRTPPLTLADGDRVRIRFKPQLQSHASAFLVLNPNTSEESCERILNVHAHNPAGGFIAGDTVAVEVFGDSFTDDDPITVTGFLEII